MTGWKIAQLRDYDDPDCEGALFWSDGEYRIAFTKEKWDQIEVVEFVGSEPSEVPGAPQESRLIGRRPKEATTRSYILDWVVIDHAHKQLGGRVREKGAPGKWVLPENWQDKAHRIQKVSQSTGLKFDASPEHREFLSDATAWPSVDSPAVPGVREREYDFDTRTFNVQPLWQTTVLNGFRVIPAGAVTGLTYPVDAWHNTITPSASMTLKRVSTARGEAFASTTTEAPSERIDLTDYTLYRASHLVLGLPTSEISYTHKLKYVNDSTHIGYLQVVTSASGIPTEQRWYVNEAVPLGLARYSLNPLRDLQLVAATGKIVLSSGTWYSTRCPRVY